MLWDAGHTIDLLACLLVHATSRAVDQALCLLACLRMLKVHQEGDPIPADRLRDVIVSTRERILDTFGFASPRTALSYLENEEECGLRFVWQEIWVSFALLFSASLLDDPSQGYKQVSTLFRDLCTTYLDRTDKVPEGMMAFVPVGQPCSLSHSFCCRTPSADTAVVVGVTPCIREQAFFFLQLPCVFFFFGGGGG